MPSLGTLSSVQSTLLPPNVVGPIFDLTSEASAVQQLARKVPLALNAATAIPVSMDVPVAGWVSEGQAKPVGSEAVGVKQMTGKKLALLVPVSEELARTNSAGLYDQLKQDLPIALARAFDYATIHGKDLRTGAAGPFGEYLKLTTNSVELSNTASPGTNYTELVNGEEFVVNAGFDFSGFAIDPRLKPKLKKQLDSTGRPIWVNDPHEGLNAGQLIGYPAYSNRGVSGVYTRHGNRVQVLTITGSPTGGNFTIAGNGRTAQIAISGITTGTIQTAVQSLGGPFSAAVVTGSGPYTITLAVQHATYGTGASAPLAIAGLALTGGTSPSVTVAQSTDIDAGNGKLRAIGGDFSQAAWGQGMDITVKVSTEAAYVDEAGTTHSAFQENLVLLLVEAYYGFVLGNPQAFVAYTDNV